MNRALAIFITATVASATVAVSQSPQPLPLIGVLIGTTVGGPAEADSREESSRYFFGAQFALPKKNGSEIRLGVVYRIETGSFASALDTTTATTTTLSKLHVVDPTQGSPKVISSISTSSIELQGMLMFPVADIDTSGSKVMIGVGGFGDYMLSASQSDDYNQIPNYPDPRIRDYKYESQIGGGVLVGLGAQLPMGTSTRLSLDVQYSFHAPTTVKNAAGTTYNVNWIIGRGFRLNAALWFGL